MFLEYTTFGLYSNITRFDVETEAKVPQKWSVLGRDDTWMLTWQFSHLYSIRKSWFSVVLSVIYSSGFKVAVLDMNVCDLWKQIRWSYYFKWFINIKKHTSWEILIYLMKSRESEY